MIHRRHLITSAFALPACLMNTHDRATAAEPAFLELDPHLLSDLYPDLEITFYARGLVSGSVAMMNVSGAETRRTPYSTFKIANLVIALETGVARDLSHWRRWDPVHRPAADHWPQNWRQDQSLATAFRRSAVWYFRDVAIDVGTAHYRKELARFGYGNADVPEHRDDFWLGGSLEISPREQTEFLGRLLDGSLGVSTDTMSALREVSLVRASAGHALFGKSGSGPRYAGDIDGPFEGWFVGWVERNDRPVVSFALYASGPDYASIRTTRQASAALLLSLAGHLPKDWSSSSHSRLEPTRQRLSKSMKSAKEDP